MADPLRYDIEGESLTITEVWQRVRAAVPGISRKAIRDRITLQGWRTWAQLKQSALRGARSPWRKFHPTNPYFASAKRREDRRKAGERRRVQ